jgi:phage I-like protein
MTKPALHIALCAAQPLPETGVPDWVHLLPAAGGKIATYDGRGPYRISDPAAIIAASMHADSRDVHGLIIDENHSTDLAQPLGLPSPARGHITEMDVRADGIWGRVKWGQTGIALLTERAYRGISPVIIYRPDGTVLRIARASLVNYQNLRGLVALNSESVMDLKQLAMALGLNEAATMEDILAAVEKLKGGGKEAETALQSEIGTILGVTGDRAALLAAVRLAADGNKEMAALHTQMTAQANDLKALKDASQRAASEAYIDAQIAQKRMGLNKGNRAEFVSLHMSQPDICRKMVEGMPLGSETHTAQLPAARKGNDLTALNAEQQGRALHDMAVALQTEQAAKGVSMSLFEAINKVKEGLVL